MYTIQVVSQIRQNLRKNQKRFGCAMILLAGDFSQTLPVIPQSTPADELNACLKSLSYGKTLKRSNPIKTCELNCRTTNLEKIFPNNCSTLVMAKYLLIHRLDTSYFLQIFITMLKLRPNSSRRFCQTLLKITKIMYG
jgi:hypothetical protein|uniref:ATP-dependent DNA helicase n=1 Tax=Sipha flava TaxID=143950 RepID=A0A2S2Q554_9HEMI